VYVSSLKLHVLQRAQLLHQTPPTVRSEDPSQTCCPQLYHRGCIPDQPPVTVSQ